MRPLAPALLALASALACADAPVPSPAGPVRDVADFLARLHQLDDLPRLEPVSSGLFSTWDRSGHNTDDGLTYLDVDGSTNVLLDVDGPGCIHRIATGLLDGDEFQGMILDAQFELWLDGERVLDLPAAELFDPVASPFAGPLVTDGAFPTSRMPIPFAEHAKIQLISPEQRWGAFWQIGYTRYPDEVPVETLALPLDAEAEAAFDRAGEAWLDALAGVIEGEGEPERITGELAPGDSLTWTDGGCGTITRLEVELDPNWPAAWRALEVRATWDGAEAPAVAMTGERLFVGSDYGDDIWAPFDSVALGAAEGRAWLRLPMPYREAATIELRNTADNFDFTATLVVHRDRCEAQPDDFGYFHATVHTSPSALPDGPTSGPLDVPVHPSFTGTGPGKLVGTGLRVYWPYPNSWWGEGDWQLWIDEDPAAWPPTLHFSGTEEYFDGGWTVVERRPLTGAVRQRPGLVTFYGFQLADAYQYRDSIHVQVETLGLLEAHDDLVTTHREWTTTTYRYDAEP